MRLTRKRALVTGASRGIGAAFTKALARGLGPKEATANLVQPGPIDTDMFPASARAQYITGSTFTVGGGANA